jgi:hypothetical protein
VAVAEETGHDDRDPIGKTVWARLTLDAPKWEAPPTS